MPPNSEIEKLERRWRENPKGTVFAPYAEVLRKNGDHELAKDILRQGLELHPDHIPGNIVLGRCSLDLGEDGPAEKAFSHVLDLDPENVIALKALADITERQGRLAEARQWLGRLITVDPSNDEARDQTARVEATQQAAATVITSAVQVTPEVEVEDTVEIIPPPLPSTVKTREIEAFARPKAGPLAEPDRSESGGGQIRDVEPARIVDDVEATFDAMVPIIEAPVGHVLDSAEAKTVELEPLMPPEPVRIMDLEPAELDIAESAKTIETPRLSGMEIGEEFIPPAEEKPAIELRASGLTEFQAPDASNELLDITPASHSEFQAPDASNELLDITPASHSEFQTPDASHELLSLASSGQSEFQEPDASQELMALSGSSNSEYQSPSGSEDLLPRSRDAEVHQPEPEPVDLEPVTAARELEPVSLEAEPVAAAVEPEPVAAEPLDEEGGPSLIADLDALTTAPTEEMATALLPAIEEPAASATEAPEAVDLTEPARAEEELASAPVAPDWLFEDSAEHPAAEEPVAEISDRIADAYADAETPVLEASHLPGDLDSDLAVPAEEEPLTEVGSGRISEEKPSGDLKLIFPDDAALPEPHQVRRITQEVELPAMAGEVEENEHEPIVTESMAELYARQGHTAEALKVYRALADRSPNDARLRERIAELEVRQPQSQRRMTYVALETGGESVESFFRSLADSRPGGQRATMHATGTIEDDGSGAPTRPARDPLSLSAIFGEDPAAAKASTAPVAPSGNSGADAFSFDQFFGGAGGGAQAPARQESPTGEDLDQFQHWLKSLKK